MEWYYIIALIGVGFVAGFIHFGVGFFLLAGLILGCGYSLVKANAIKYLLFWFLHWLYKIIWDVWMKIL